MRIAHLGDYSSSYLGILESRYPRLKATVLNPRWHRRVEPCKILGIPALRRDPRDRVTAICQQLFGSCVANGGAAWDHSGMVQALEQLANHKIAE